MSTRNIDKMRHELRSVKVVHVHCKKMKIQFGSCFSGRSETLLTSRKR